MRRTLFTLLFAMVLLPSLASEVKDDAEAKIKQLMQLTKKAESKGIDTSYEQATLWFAECFLRYADWDEANVDANVRQFSAWSTYRENAEQMAHDLPDFERSEVVKMLSHSITEIKMVLKKDIQRRAVPKIDWCGIKLSDGQFRCGERAVYINDYFSKQPGFDNDYFGALDHTSLSLNYIANLEGELSQFGKERIINREDKNSGYVLLWHGKAPGWAMERFPNLQKGQRYFTHYDIDNPNIRDMWRAAFKETIPMLKGRPTTDIGYILSNEPHWYTKEKGWATGDVSEYTMEKFRDWLKEKHNGDIGELNRLWRSNYSDFSSVNLKIPFAATLVGTPTGYDWMRFNMDRVTEWFKFLDAEIKRYDADAKTHLKVIPHHFTEDGRDHGLDFEALVEITDILGNDAKIKKKETHRPGKEYWEGRYSYDWREVALSYDFFKSVSPEKANVNSESHFVSTSRYRDLYMTPEYVRSCYWLATMQGMDVSLTWFWAREVDGSIRADLLNYTGPDNAMKNAYAASVAQQPRVANQIAQTMMELNSFSDEVERFQRLKQPIRLFYSETSAINNDRYMEGLFELYEPMFFCGTPIGFATKNIINKQDNAQWSVIAVRDCEYVTDAEFAALQSYLERGGTVILDDISLRKDEYGRPRSTQLRGKIIGAETVSEFTDALGEYVDDEVEIHETNQLDSKGCYWRVAPCDDGGLVLSIINLGACETELEITRGGREPNITDMFSGRGISNKLTLKSDGNLLLKLY